MAESDTRLETLEDEVKVLKGEVKRTLVDLRALLMREDSPLGDGGSARRAAMPDQVPGNGAGSNGMIEVASQPQAGPAAVRESEDASVDSGSPVDDEQPAPGLGPPLDDLPGVPPQAGPGPVPGVLSDEPWADSADQHDSREQGQATPAAEGRAGPSRRTSRQKSPEGGETETVSRPEASPRSRGRNRTKDLGAAQEESSPAPAEREAKVSSVYDEYRELLEETQQTYSIEDSPVGPPLDINVLSNLVYWTALAKQRVGEARLKDILRLYIQSGHSRPELQDLLLQVADMVDAEPVVVSETSQEWVDLMFQLHGILTGGFPVIKLPPIRLASRENDEAERS